MTASTLNKTTKNLATQINEVGIRTRGRSHSSHSDPATSTTHLIRVTDTVNDSGSTHNPVLILIELAPKAIAIDSENLRVLFDIFNRNKDQARPTIEQD